MTYSFAPILNHLPPMPTNIFLFASTSFEARCQCPMVTPTSLNGAGCATALAAASVDANKRPAIKLFMQSSQMSRRSDGRVGADASTLPGCTPRKPLPVGDTNRYHTPGIPRAVTALRIECVCTQLAIGGPERELAMAMRRDFILLMILVAAVATPAFGQSAPPAVAPTQTAAPEAASIPDFSGVWRHGSLPWLIPPASGPGPVTNRSRRSDSGVSNYGELVGDYTNPTLQPWAAEVVKKKGALSLAGVTYPSPSNQCWPEPVPFLFKHMAMSMLQLPDRIVMLFSEDHEVRWVLLNQPHPEKVTPSWHGDAVGHYEGDTLVIDTIGIKADRPYAMNDLFGTPYTEKLHVIERYRL